LSGCTVGDGSETVFQMDQATPANQSFLRNVGKRCEAQVWIGVCSYLLVAIVRKRLGLDNGGPSKEQQVGRVWRPYSRQQCQAVIGDPACIYYKNRPAFQTGGCNTRTREMDSCLKPIPKMAEQG
jgi:hypothetical protein